MAADPAYTTVEAARQHRAMASTNATDAQVAAALVAAERRIEKATDVAWVPRETVEHLEGNGGAVLRLSNLRCRKLLKVVIDDEEQDLADFGLTRAGRLTRDGDTFPDGVDVEITYEHGSDQPPDDLVDAAIRAAATALAHAGNPRIGERTDTIVAEGMTINFSAVADLARGRPFGMPDVDTVVMSHALHRPLVG